MPIHVYQPVEKCSAARRVGRILAVAVTDAGVSITNEGAPLPFSEEQLFQRFVRNQALPQSTGLALALVKEIAGQYGMTVAYRYAPLVRQHTFQISF